MGLAFVVMCAEPVLAAKDQTRLPEAQGPAAAGGGLGSAPFAPSPGNEPLLQLTPDDQEETDNDNTNANDDIQEMAPAISTVETVELTPDLAKRAIDGFVKLKNTYQDTDIAEYESLEQFVAQAKEGPALEKDIKSFGFKTVGEWNTAITSVSFAYAALSGTHEDEIRQELENIEKEVDLDQQMKTSLVEGLKSMLPSDNNKKIVADLNKQKVWAEKLKLLEETENEADH
ncbi:MAG: hypothetical protein ABJM26_06390 [Anderseniella sp.]